MKYLWYRKIYWLMDRAQKLWTWIFLGLVAAASVVFGVLGDNGTWWRIGLNWILSPISALTGVVCVILVARSSISNWTWGLVNSVAYGFVAWVGGYYGDWMLNWFFFVPTQVLIWKFWKTKLRIPEFGLVRIQKLDRWSLGVVSLAAIAGVFGLGIFLQLSHDFFAMALKRSETFYDQMYKFIGIKGFGPLLDSATVMLQIVGEILLIARYREQWYFWIATNGLSVMIWAVIVISDPVSWSWSVPTLLMWVAFLINSVSGLVYWNHKVEV